MKEKKPIPLGNIMRALTLLMVFGIHGSSLLAQGTWMWTMRTHPELTWMTIQTDHFNIHFHNGIEEIGKKGANIAEQVWPTLLKQLDLKDTPKIDVTFTSADEIMNGYAMPSNQVFIWVDQNDAIVWLEDEKWLYQVISHELQHIALMNGLKTWIPEPWSMVFSGTPGWFIEGSAEYFTEKWRPNRADISHKWHILKNKTKGMDPHHDGFSKMKYWGERFGDSTIVKLMKHRNKSKTFNFKKAFKKNTGVELTQFEEDWRRHMNTYYYSYRSQKETLLEAGKVASLPMKNVNHFSISPDSLQIAIAGSNDENQMDMSLVIATREIKKEKKKLLSSLFNKKEKEKKKKKETPKYKIDEVDHGAIGDDITWSANGKMIAYSKYRYGKNGAILWDIRVYDLEHKKGRWLTKNFRSSNPQWSPDGEKIVFTAHVNGTANLYTIKTDGSELAKITSFDDDTQIVSPAWSPDGKRIAFALSGPDGNCDIYVKEVGGNGAMERLTTDASVDYLPIWHPEGDKITFTSHRNSTPNLYTIDLNTNEVYQTTDAGEPIWGIQWTPKGKTIVAKTFSDVDSSRVIYVDPVRKVDLPQVSISDTYTKWRTKMPETELKSSTLSPASTDYLVKPYRFFNHPKMVTWLMIPDLDFQGLFGLAVLSDGLGRHIFQAGGLARFDTTSNSFFVGYTNAATGPIWGVDYISNARYNYRSYDGGDLFERVDGWRAYAFQIYNQGTNIESNHVFGASLSLNDIQAELYLSQEDSLDRSLPDPEDGKEGILSVNYRYLSRRPHLNNIYLPKQGWGVSFAGEIADKKAFGDFTYARWTIDAFNNVSLGPLTFYGRFKSVRLNGNPPNQKYVGLTNDSPFYAPLDGSSPTASGLIIFEENHSPRGWKGETRLGDKLVFSTLELRLPIATKLPINLIGFTLGSVTAAAISDIGNSWFGVEMPEWIVTFGGEIKFALKIGDAILFNFAYGQAQEIHDWQENKNPERYLRMVLINPF